MSRGLGRASLVALVSLAFVVGTPNEAAAEDTVWFSPGIKLGYTRDEGFTLGFEVSVVAVPNVDSTDLGDIIQRGVLVGYGFAFSYDFAFGNRVAKTHIGVEWVGPGIGLQFGPTLVRDREGRYFGLTLMPWLGTYAIPYLNWTGVVGRDNLLEFGVLLKYHACVSGEDACGDGDDLDDID